MKTCEIIKRKRRDGRKTHEGTEYGYKLHLKAGEEPCPECKAASQEAHRVRGARALDRKREHYREWDPERDLSCEKPAPTTPSGVRGTRTGFGRHKRAGETPCPECAEAWRVYRLETYHAKKDQYREKRNSSAAARREEKREELREYDRNYYQEHKDRSRVVRRARHTKAKGTWDGHTTETIIKAHGSDCYLCGTPVDLSIPVGYSDSPQRDHVVPLIDPESPGDVLGNVRLTHARCNLAKSNKRVEDLDLPFMPPGHEVYASADTEKEEAYA